MVDNQQTYNDLVGFVGPSGALRICFARDPSSPPYFIAGVEQQIQGALARKITLGQGGYIVFDETEAMVVDVNTGQWVNIVLIKPTETNLEAAKIIAHQRLRNLSGIIVIDFIDMKSAVHRNQVLSG